jgi:hypothetical protein
MNIREADEADGPALVQFFLETPMRAGTEFVLDRSPDFRALLRLRGRFRTFVAFAGDRVAGTITTLWHERLCGELSLYVGEIADLRVARWARGGQLTARLLTVARDAFASERTDWIVCLIGENNRDALGLVRGKAGFPALRPLGRYASTHYPAFRVPAARNGRGVHVRTAGGADAQLLADLVAALTFARSFSPPDPFPWPDPEAQHRGWIAMNADARPIGALVVWDGMPVRRIRVVRYGGSDHALRAVMALAALAGVATALPPPGGALRLWASRWFGVVGADPLVARALVRAAVRAAALRGQHVLQINLAEDDPLLRALPSLPHSVYWTWVYACQFGTSGDATLPDRHRMCFADLALV